MRQKSLNRTSPWHFAAKCIVAALPFVAFVAQARWILDNTTFEAPIRALQFLWPSAAGTLALAGLSATSSVNKQHQWWALAGGIIIGAFVLSIPQVLMHASNPRENVLRRDMLALFVLVGAIPALCAAATWMVNQLFAMRWLNVACCVVTGATCLLSSPFVLLGVHCTSGDCL
jgi:hypothetical protein